MPFGRHAEIRQLMRDRLQFEYGRKQVSIATDQIELNAGLRYEAYSGPAGTGASVARDAIRRRIHNLL